MFLPYPRFSLHSVMKTIASTAAIIAILLISSQNLQPSPAQNVSTTQKETYVGDAPADPGPLAKDVSEALKPQAIRHVVRKVADWQLSRAQSHFNQDWTYAALYRGLIAASRATGDSKYEDAVKHASERFEWKLGPRICLSPTTKPWPRATCIFISRVA